MLTGCIPAILEGDFRVLSRCISAVENRSEGYEVLLENLPADTATRVIGITGPPGAGKSTVTDALVTALVQNNRRIAVLAVDPSSPFHHGALLGDRIRMNTHYTDPNVFIRSLATRGSLGGLHPEIIGISTLVCAAGFDYLIIETVGVGQSEVEVAAMADTTVVVMVPESGDEIQTMKAGLMEIADIFVVNKSDHAHADAFVKNLRALVQGKRDSGWRIPVIKTVATTGAGISELLEKIRDHQKQGMPRRSFSPRLLAEKAFQLIATRRMKDINLSSLEQSIRKQTEKGQFNLYRFVRDYQR
ncbi:MAG TPA: methylmalonyl Co-A mutase-associated GTPase MeaB [Chitinophagaceae bacterium]|nr:methylmalonyl Co-A mutase-associated GTPase MeaB [Chitinophagaceae bacterium]